MDISTAKNYFKNFDSIEELEDLFEEEVFKIKQYLIAHFPISKVYTSKVSKVFKLYDAYRMLGGDELFEKKSEIVKGTYSSDNLLDAFRAYSMVFNSFKMRLMSAEGVKDIEGLVEQILNETKAYAACWRLNDDQLSKIIVSKSPDEIALLTAFKELKNTSLSEIQNLDKENQLFKEANRLSLWLNREQNG